MDQQSRKIKRRHASMNQKLKMMKILTKHPLLIQGKFTKEFTIDNGRRVWQLITRELNAFSGGTRKTWKEWRKTWWDMYSKYKTLQKERPGVIPELVSLLTPVEQKMLGFKNVGPAPTAQETTEPLESNSPEINNFHEDMDSAGSLSEPGSPPETKVFTTSYGIKNIQSSSRHSETCEVNCKVVAEFEQKKLELKEDFINFKKDYLRKKLELMQEQTEALKAIARELSET